MRGDYKSRMEGYAIGRQNGWLSINDIRRLEDMSLVPADKGGDEYLVNGNMITATEPTKKTEGGNDEGKQKGTEDAPDEGTANSGK